MCTQVKLACVLRSLGGSHTRSRCCRWGWRAGCAAASAGWPGCCGTESGTAALLPAPLLLGAPAAPPVGAAAAAGAGISGASSCSAWRRGAKSAPSGSTANLEEGEPNGVLRRMLDRSRDSGMTAQQPPHASRQAFLSRDTKLLPTLLTPRSPPLLHRPPARWPPPPAPPQTPPRSRRPASAPRLRSHPPQPTGCEGC